MRLGMVALLIAVSGGLCGLHSSVKRCWGGGQKRVWLWL